MRRILLDAHASAASVALLATPKFVIDECFVDLQACGNAGNYRDQRLSVRLSGCAETKHKPKILQERSRMSAFRAPKPQFCDAELRR
jgi:hypothetical protein